MEILLACRVMENFQEAKTAASGLEKPTVFFENPIYRFLVLLMYSILKEVSGKKLRGVLRKTGLKNKIIF